MDHLEERLSLEMTKKTFSAIAIFSVAGRAVVSSRTK
jgi:hypothetical protein